MKRIIILTLLLLVMVSGVFALDKAIGFGAMYNHSFTKGLWKTRWLDPNGSFYDIDTDWTLNRNGFGAFIFFGLSQYFELNLGFLYKNPIQMIQESSDGNTQKWDKNDLSRYWEPTFALQGGVYLKYPITISDIFVFFPTAGADFEYTFAGENEWWWSDIWLRGGMGLDIFFTDRLFLRTHFIYGVALPVLDEPIWGIKISHGLLGKIGLGWMF